MPVLDLVTLPVRLATSTIDTARSLARLADMVSASLEPGGSLERLTRQGGPLSRLAGRIPGARRKAPVDG